MKQLSWVLLLVVVFGFWAVGCESNDTQDNDYDFVGDDDTEGTDGDGETDGDTDGDVDGDTDGDVDGDTDGDVDGDTDGDVDGDTDGDVDGDTDGDVDGDGDPDVDGDVDGDVVEPTLAFVVGGDPWEVTYDDDVSDDAGMQLDINLTSTDVAEDTVVQLTVNSGDPIDGTVDADGNVSFAAVTLVAGANTLSAVADPDGEALPTAEATVTLTGSRIAFVEGGDPWEVSYDDDTSGDAGMQVNISLTTDNVAENTDVVLTVGEGDPLGPVMVDADGNVLFENVTLLPGDNALAATVDPTGAASPTAAATITLTGSRLAFVAGSTWTVSYVDDTSEAAGLQIDVELLAENVAENTSVALDVDGTAFGPATVGADGAILFEDVTVLPGDNVLLATVDPDGAASPTATATVSVTGCRLAFAEPLDEASFADGGSCSVGDCGDDLDCVAPNLQRNVIVQAENVADDETISLVVAGAAPITATVQSGQAQFDMVGLPHGTEVSLMAEADSATRSTCQAEIAVDVDITCGCHLELTPVPADLNRADALALDSNLDDGLQVTYVATSDNCADGSAVSFTFDSGTPVDLVLTNGEASAEFTLSEDVHTLEVGIDDGAGRIGLAGPYSFSVDLTLPEFGTITPDDGTVYTRVEDKNQDLGDGIQFDVSGQITGVEDLDPPLELTLAINGEDFANTEVSGGAFTFTDVTLTDPNVRAPAPENFTLELRATDALGNPASTSFGVVAYFDEPSLTILTIGGYAADTADLKLNISDDASTGTDLLQTTVVVQSQLVPLTSMEGLRINGGAGVAANSVVGDDIEATLTWNVELDYGDYTFEAASTILSGLTSDMAQAWADWEIPTLTFNSPTDEEYSSQNVMDVEIYSDAEIGQVVTLNVNGSPWSGGTVALNDSNIALFQDVDISENATRTTADYTLSADVDDFAGNSALTTGVTVHFDSDAPTVAVTVPNPPINYNTNVTVNAAIAGEPNGSQATFRLYEAASYVANPADPCPVAGALQTDVVALASGSATQAYGTAQNPLSDNTYAVCVRYTDMAGNLGWDDNTFEVDTGCFTFSIATDDGKTVYNIADAFEGNTANGVHTTINVTASGSRPILDGQQVVLRVDGSLAGFATMSGDPAEASFPVTLTEGTTEIQVYYEPPVGSNCYGTPNPLALKVDFTSPALTLSAPFAYDPAVAPAPATYNYNAASVDAVAGGDFQTPFTIHSDNAEEGQTVALTVSNGLGRVDNYSQALDASGDAVFPEVTLFYEGGAATNESAVLTLSATVSDAAGNPSTALEFTTQVDRSVPSFTSITAGPSSKAPGSTLNSSDDDNQAIAGFQLRIRANVEGGTVGQNVTASYRVVGDTTYTTIGDFAVQGTPGNRYFTMSGTFNEGEYEFRFVHTDSFGNTGELSPPAYYKLDFVAGIVLSDTNGDRLPTDDVAGPFAYEWNVNYDQNPGSAGFQAYFDATTNGFDLGATVYICSNVGLHAGNGGLSTCTHDPDGVGGDTFYRVASATVVQGLGDTGLATFSVNLVDEADHIVFTEGSDNVGNFAHSTPVTITMDSVAPTVSSLVFPDNSTGNDDTVNNVLRMNTTEGTVDGSNLTFDVTVNVSGSDADYVNLYHSNSNTFLAGPVAVSGGQAVFTDVVRPNGFDARIKAQVVDQLGNLSSLTATAALQKIRVDLIGPAASFEGGPGQIQLVVGACGGNDGQSRCLASVQINVDVNANEAFSLEGGTVTLSGPDSKVSVQQTIPSYSSTPVPVEFTDFPIPQGTQTLSVTVSDLAANSVTETNEFYVDSVVPTLAIATPSADGSYADADNDDTTCGDGGGLSDLLLRRCDWQVSATGIDGQTEIELQWRQQGDTSFQTFPSASSQTISSNNTAVGFNPLDFPRGTIEVRAFATETASGNTATSALRTMAVAFNPGDVLQVEKVSVGDGVPDTGDEMASGTTFKAGEDQNGGAPFGVNIQLVTNGFDGLTPTLTVNGSAVSTTLSPTSGVITSGKVVYNNVSLNEAPATNVIAATVNDGLGGTASVSLTNIVADSSAPVITFTRPTPGSTTYYNITHDNGAEHNGQMDLKTAYDIQIESDDTTVAGRTATLTATDGTSAVALFGTATATFPSSCTTTCSLTFSSVILPTTNSLPNGWLELGVTVSDAAGNDASVAQVPRIVADDDKPADATALEVCLGSNTTTAGGDDAYRKDSANCVESYACDNDDDRCDRHAGNATMVWTAPAADGFAGTGTVTAYTVEYETFTDEADPCSQWGTGDTHAAVTVTVDAIVAPTEKQGAVVASLPINTNTSTCFRVQAQDAAGNTSDWVYSGRETAYAKTQIATDLGGSDRSASGFGFFAEWGDFNGDGCYDVATNDAYFVTGGGAAGAVWVIYGDDGDSCTPLADWAVYGRYKPSWGLGDTLGYSFAVGDLNGDDIDDLAIGAESYNFYDGRAYIYFGSTSGLSTTASSYIEECGEAGLSCPANTHCDLCGCVPDAGVANCGNGSADSGEECGEPGLSCGGGQVCSDACICIPDYRNCGDTEVDAYEPTIEPDVTISAGLWTGGAVGTHLEILNWNGAESGQVYADLFISTQWYSAADGPIYGFLGRGVWGNWYDAGTDEDLTVLRQAGSTGFYGSGEGNAPNFGWFMSHADVNNDGYDELIISDIDHQESDGAGGTRTLDRAWLLWGNSATSGVLQPVADADWANPEPRQSDPYFFEIPATDANEAGNFGFYVAGVLDTNNDGLDEVLVRKNTQNKLLYYKSSTASPNVVTEQSWSFIHDSDTYFGLEPGTAMDMNHDGYNDVVVGGTGLVRLFWGQTPYGIVDNTENPGDPENDYIDLANLPASPSVLQAMGGGDFNSDGYYDLVVINRTSGNIFLIW